MFGGKLRPARRPKRLPYLPAGARAGGWHPHGRTRGSVADGRAAESAPSPVRSGKGKFQSPRPSGPALGHSSDPGGPRGQRRHDGGEAPPNRDDPLLPGRPRERGTTR